MGLDLFHADDIEELLEYMTPEERAEFTALIEADMRAKPWRPQEGPQLAAYESMADVTGFGGAAGGGKGLALDTPLPTPTGWTTMGAAAVGDMVLDETGAPCRVTAASEVRHRPCFRLRFDDGSEIVADDVHRWRTFDSSELSALTRLTPEWRENRRCRRASKSSRVLSPDFHAEPPTGTVRNTAEIAASLKHRGRRNHAIRLAGALDLPPASLPVDPYVLGIWLGGGTTQAATVTTIDQPVLDEIAVAGHRHALACRSDTSTWRVFGLQAELRALGVLGNKHVPSAYLRASMPQRLALLQGLMDSDGHAALDGGCEFDSTSERLSLDTWELALSLGIKARLTTGTARLRGRAISRRWRVSFSTDLPAFRLARKRQRQGCSRRALFRYIVGCDPVSSVPTRCIAVDSPTRMYLAGRQMIPTHNTDLAAGLTLEHKRTLYVRRQRTQTTGFANRLEFLLGTSAGYNSTTGEWRLGPDQFLTIAGCDNPGDEKKQQGIPRDLHIYDEVTEQREWQVRYMMGWNRTEIEGQRVRTLMNFNPPTTAEGRWVLRYFGPWIDPKGKRAADGELLWMANIGDEPEVVLPDNRRFVIDEKTREWVYDFDPNDYKGARQTLIIRPRSRTFIQSRVTDNRYYVKSGYIGTLQDLPEPLRSQMLFGDFKAGIEDDASQLIPTAWIEAAMKRWQPRHEKGPMDSLGVDVSRGNMGGSGAATGKDRTVIAPRHGTWFDDLKAYKGINVMDGPAVASKVIALRRDNAVVHIDIVGVGTSPHDFLVASHVQTVAINGAAKSLGMTSTGQLQFVNLRSELYWRMREALDPTNPRPLYLPDDAELLADLAAPRWWLTPAGIQVEPKKGKPTADGKPTGLIARLGRSPDKGDAVVYALVATPKRNVLIGGYANLPPHLHGQGYDRNAELAQDQGRR